ncbi:MAG: hydrogenase [Prolixibacteraceae bacterium]|nr:hydrogenase [Prolixibacteraceae bacterium]
MDNSTLQKQLSNKLLYSGVLLFLLGLITGLIVPILANPRMGVSSHIEGVLNGMFLIILSLIWSKIRLSDRWLKITFWLAIYGTFMNWLGILIASIFNGGKMLGIMAEGQEGSPVVEGIINFSLMSLSIAMIIICIAILFGLRKPRTA